MVFVLFIHVARGRRKSGLSFSSIDSRGSHSFFCPICWMFTRTPAHRIMYTLVFLILWFRSYGCDENTVIKFEPSDSSDGPDLSNAEPIFFYLFSLCFLLIYTIIFTFLFFISLTFKVCLFIFTFFISFNLLVYYLRVFYFRHYFI